MNAKIHIILDGFDYLLREVPDYLFKEVPDYLLFKSLREHLIINISFQSGKIAIDEKRRH